ncbi:MAG: hypothetical protein AAF557_04705 [Pseudomonadota bacterium]
MFAPDEQTLEAWMKPPRDAFEFWISFFPTAPLFGVEWRFGQMVDLSGKSPAKADAPIKVKKTAPEPAKKAAPVAHERVEPRAAPVAEAKPAPVVEAKPAPVAAPKAAPVKAVTPANTEKKPTAKPAETAESATVADEAVLAKPKGLLAKAPADADDLKLIKGVGPGLEKQLNALGIYRFNQLAKFKEADLAWVDDSLSSFKGRCFRDDWVGQAKTLMA